MGRRRMDEEMIEARKVGFLEAMDRAVQKVGLGNVRASDVAKEAGCSVGTFYRYWTTFYEMKAAWVDRYVVDERIKDALKTHIRVESQKQDVGGRYKFD